MKTGSILSELSISRLILHFQKLSAFINLVNLFKPKFHIDSLLVSTEKDIDESSNLYSLLLENRAKTNGESTTSSTS